MFKYRRQRLIAVGGYGRRELLPHSDIDLLLLINEEQFDNLKESLEAFITFLWDTKLDIGHSIRSVKECQEQAAADITITTNAKSDEEARALLEAFNFPFKEK